MVMTKKERRRRNDEEGMMIGMWDGEIDMRRDNSSICMRVYIVSV